MNERKKEINKERNKEIKKEERKKDTKKERKKGDAKQSWLILSVLLLLLQIQVQKGGIEFGLKIVVTKNNKKL